MAKSSVDVTLAKGRYGIASTSEMYLSHDPICRALTESGVKANISRCVTWFDDASYYDIAYYQQAMDAIREVFGPTVKAYSYGIDEGSAWAVRAERATWKGVHRAGGNTIVATQWHPFILFNLDYANVPRHPRASSIGAAISR